MIWIAYTIAIWRNLIQKYVKPSCNSKTLLSYVNVTTEALTFKLIHL